MQFEENRNRDMEHGVQTFSLSKIIGAEEEEILFGSYTMDTTRESKNEHYAKLGNTFLRNGFAEAIKEADEGIVIPMYVDMYGKSIEHIAKDEALDQIEKEKLSIVGFKFNSEATEEQKANAFDKIKKSFIDTSSNATIYALSVGSQKKTSFFAVDDGMGGTLYYSNDGDKYISKNELYERAGLESNVEQRKVLDEKREDILKALVVTQDGKEEDKANDRATSNDTTWLDRYFQNISDLSDDKKGTLHTVNKTDSTVNCSLEGEKHFQFIAENKCVVTTSPEQAKPDDFKAIVELAKKEGKNIRLGSEMTDDFRYALVQACAREGVRISNLPEDCKGLYAVAEQSAKKEVPTFDIDKDKLPKIELVPGTERATKIDLNDYADKIKALQPGETLTFGRAPSNDKAKENIEIPSANDSVSRNHFSIVCDKAGKLHLQDTSSYGTKVSETNDTVSKIQKLRGLMSGLQGARKNPAVQKLQAEKLVYNPKERD